MVVTVAELAQTDLYPEIIQKITRGNDTEAELQILTAEDLVKSYLGKYDTLAIFGTSTVAATFDSPIIKKMVKSIASWYLVKRANPNVNLELFRAEFEDAIDWLKDLQAGKVTPDLPYKATTGTTEAETGTGVSWSSNTKRMNHL